MNSIAN